MSRVYKKGVHYSPKTEFKKGQRGPRYLPIGSRRLKCGRWWIKVSPHGHADSNWKAEHVIVAEQILGRPIKKGEHVHHIDFDITNNNPNNLCVVVGNSAHQKIHVLEPLVSDLMKRGLVKFDKERGIYYGC